MIHQTKNKPHDHHLWISAKAFLCALWAVAGLSTGSCGGGKEAQEDEKDAPEQALSAGETAEVKAFALREQDFQRELVSNGTVRAAQKADLRFENEGIVEDIFVKNGQRVQKGQKIAQLEPFKLESALKQASEALEKAKLDLQDILIGQGYAPADSLKVPEETMRIARVKSNYGHSVVQHEMAGHNLSRSVLYAPYDGVVANLSAKKHNLPPAGEPFCTVIATEGMDALFTVLETELPLVRKGDRVELSPFSVQNGQVSAVVDEINPLVDENGMVKVKARIQGRAQGLYEGMNVRVRVQRSSGKQLVIPKEALVLRNNRKVVFTAKNGMALWNYVQTGQENSTGYVVTEGLRAGDSVIYEGNLNLAHETPIKVVE